MWLPKHDTSFLPAVKEGETKNAADGSARTTMLTMVYLCFSRDILFVGCVATILSAGNTATFREKLVITRACQSYSNCFVMLQRRAHEFKIYSNDFWIVDEVVSRPKLARRVNGVDSTPHLDFTAIVGYTDGTSGQPGHLPTIFATKYRYAHLHISTEIC